MVLTEKKERLRRYGRTGFVSGLFVGVLFLCFWLSGKNVLVKAKTQENFSLYATAACLMDGDSGRVLFGKKEESPMAMASTTKIMTAILALETMDLSKEISASSEAAGAPKVHLGVQEGETFLVEDLLYALMLESYNDAAVMIAEAAAGSTEEFAFLMNQKAEDIGCQNTHFVTPNGLDAENEGGTHHTTAEDLARIMRYCVWESPKAEEFCAITGMRSYTFWDTEKKRMFQCYNHNAFLDMMEGALSGKTGFTSKAGYCYVGALEKDGKRLVVSLLACGWPNHKNYKWQDTKKLMEYALEHYQYRNILVHDWNVPGIEVEDGAEEGILGSTKAMIPLQSPVTDQTRELLVLLREEEKPEIEISLPEVVTAPVKKGEQIGKITYILDGRILAEYPITAKKTMQKIDYNWCLLQAAKRMGFRLAA